MIVYRAKHKASGASYIGATTRTLPERKANHESAARHGKRTYFCDALREFGAEAFEWEVLLRCESIEELDRAERAMIEEYKAYYDEGGFNRTRGGLLGRIEMAARLPETKERMSDSQWMKGRTHSDEMKARISAGLKRRPKDAFFRKLDDSLWPDIARRRADGESFRQLGAALGVRPETVFYFCKRNGAKA